MRLLIAPFVLAAPLVHGLEEGRLRDVRLRGGITPASGDIGTTFDVAGYPSSEDVAGFDRGIRASLGFYESFSSLDRGGSWLLGLVVSASKQESDADRVVPVSASSGVAAGEIEAEVLCIDAAVGYALPLNRRVHVEAQAFAGGGGLRITDHIVTVTPAGVQSSNTSAGDGTYYEAGLQGGAYYTFANGLQVGADAGVLAFRGKAEVTWLDPAKGEYTYSGVGPFIDLSLGLRF
jgi:hypothetical protein